MSEEVELIVESLLGVLLRTILEISNRPQSTGPAMRLQFTDVTVCVFCCVQCCMFQSVCKQYVRVSYLLLQIVWGLNNMSKSNYSFLN